MALTFLRAKLMRVDPLWLARRSPGAMPIPWQQADDSR
jgi:hypothetical protein